MLEQGCEHPFSGLDADVLEPSFLELLLPELLSEVVLPDGDVAEATAPDARRDSTVTEEDDPCAPEGPYVPGEFPLPDVSRI